MPAQLARERCETAVEPDREGRARLCPRGAHVVELGHRERGRLLDEDGLPRAQSLGRERGVRVVARRDRDAARCRDRPAASAGCTARAPDSVCRGARGKAAGARDRTQLESGRAGAPGSGCAVAKLPAPITPTTAGDGFEVADGRGGGRPRLGRPERTSARCRAASDCRRPAVRRPRRPARRARAR